LILNSLASEPQSRRAGYKYMEKDRIKQAYLNFVLNEGHPPQSVFKLTQQLGIAEQEFYTYYPNFEAIDREIWADFGRQARTTAASEPVWEGYGSREKLLAFYYTLLEILKQNRSYALMSLRRSLSRVPAISPRVLDDFRQDFEVFVSDILADGRVSGEIANRPIVQEGYPRFFWQQALFVLGFFAKDDTVNFERTDAAVEKAVTLSFDLVGRNTLDSAFDFVRFLVRR
jgi:AcrR family transcriptional regulator